MKEVPEKYFTGTRVETVKHKDLPKFNGDLKEGEEVILKYDGEYRYGTIVGREFITTKDPYGTNYIGYDIEFENGDRVEEIDVNWRRMVVTSRGVELPDLERGDIIAKEGTKYIVEDRIHQGGGTAHGPHDTYAARNFLKIRKLNEDGTYNPEGKSKKIDVSNIGHNFEKVGEMNMRFE